MKKNIYLLFLIFIIKLSLLCTEDPELNLYDALHYDINLTANLQNKNLTGFIKLVMKPITPIQKIVLLASNKTITIDSTFVNNQKTNFKHLSDKLIIDIGITLIDTTSIKIYYKAESDFFGEYDNGGVYFDLSSNSPKVATSSQPFFTRKWLPSKDVPNDKATANINLTVPDTLIAVSNGLLKNVYSNNYGQKIFCWETKYPTSTYLIAFAIGKYEIIEEEYSSISGNRVPIKYYIFPEYRTLAKSDFNNTIKMLKFMEEYFGEYPFLKEKYGIVQVPGDLIMENQTITFIKEDLITGNGDVEQFLIHELAHHWFGNMITPKSWHHLWLSEGFANYIQALYLEYYLGKKWYHHILNYYMDREPGTYKGPLVGKSDSTFDEIFSERIYFKGAIVLHMLRKLVGDSTFFKILKTYVTNPKYQYSTVTTENFIEVCESIYPSDLSWFFEQWVYTDQDTIDRPTLLVDWNITKIQDSYQIHINISQLTSHIYNYTLPIDLSIVSSQDTTGYDILISKPMETFTFFSKYEPTNIIIDKDNWVFKNVIYKKHE